MRKSAAVSVVTVQLSSMAQNMEAGYRQGFGAGLDNLVDVAERTMVLERVIRAPRSMVWAAWMNPETLPQWWGPDGFSCRTTRIDLRAGGEWVFDMIAPDGTVFPNHHRYGEVRAEERIDYVLLWGEDGPKHADAWVSFRDQDGATKVILGMVFSTAEEFQQAKGFGAAELGLQTLGQAGALRAVPMTSGGLLTCLVELVAVLLADHVASACMNARCTWGCLDNQRALRRT